MQLLTQTIVLARFLDILIKVLVRIWLLRVYKIPLNGLSVFPNKLKILRRRLKKKFGFKYC